MEHAEHTPEQDPPEQETPPAAEGYFPTEQEPAQDFSFFGGPDSLRIKPQITEKNARSLGLQSALAVGYLAGAPGRTGEDTSAMLMSGELSEQDIRAEVAQAYQIQKAEERNRALNASLASGDVDTTQALLDSETPAAEPYALETATVRALQDSARDHATVASILAEPKADKWREDLGRRTLIIQNLMQTHALRFSSEGLSENAADLAALLIPLNATRAGLNAAPGEFVGPFSGEELMKQKASIYTMSNEEFDKWVPQYAHFLEHSGLTGTRNALLSLMSLDQMLELDPQEASTETLMTFLDALPFAGGVARVATATKLLRSLRSPLRGFKMLNRQAASDTLATAVSGNLPPSHPLLGAGVLPPESTRTLRTSVSPSALNLDPEDLLDNLLPSNMSRRPDPSVGVSGEVARVQLEQQAAMDGLLKELNITSSTLSPSEVLTAFEKHKKEAELIYADTITDIKQPVHNPKTGLWDTEMLFGKARGRGGFESAEAANRSARARGFTKEVGLQEPVQDTSGQWFISLKAPLRERGSLAPLNVSSIATTNKITAAIINSLRLLPEFAGKAVLGVGREDRIRKVVVGMNRTLNDISTAESYDLQKIIRLGETAGEGGKGKWFSEGELFEEYSREFNRWPSDKEVKAYNTYKNLNALDWELNNTALYARRARAGMKEFSHKAFGPERTLRGQRLENLQNIDKGIIYDAGEKVFYHMGTNTAERAALEEKVSSGRYLLVHLDEPYEAGFDRFPVRTVLLKTSDTKVLPLDLNQLPRLPGGHRTYAPKVWLKQADIREKTLEGVTYKIKMNPIVHFASETMKDAKEYQERFEQARKAVLAFRRPASNFHVPPELDEVEMYLQEIGIENIGVWDDLVQRGKVSETHPLEVLHDREDLLTHRVEGANIMDLSDPSAAVQNTATNLMNRSRGAFNHKGDRVELVDGREAPLVSPFRAQQQAVQQAADMGSLDAYRQEMIERWVEAAHGDAVTGPSWGPNTHTVGRDPNFLFRNAKIDTTTERGQKLEIARTSLNRMLKVRTFEEQAAQTRMQSQARWLEKVTNAKVTYTDAVDILSKDWAGAAKGIIFDPILGLLSPRQWWTQTSQAAALSLAKKDPRHLGRGVALQYAYHMDPAHTGRISRATRVSTGMSDAEFKEMAEAYERSGFALVDYASVTQEGYAPGLGKIQDGINMSGRVSRRPAPMAGALAERDPNRPGVAGVLGNQTLKGVQAVRRGGRAVYHEANRLNRGTAFSVAWEEVTKANPTMDRSSPEFFELLLDRASAYDMDMNRAATRALQEGVFSLPLQFKQYMLNLTQNMIGEALPGLSGKARWDKKTRWAWGAASLLLGGASALPSGQSTVQKAMTDFQRQNQTDIPDALEVAVRQGVPDGLSFWLSDGDLYTAYGPNAVSGYGWSGEWNNLVLNKPLLDTVLGPAGTKIPKMAQAFYQSVATVLNPAVKGQLTKEEAFEAVMVMARQINSARDAEQALRMFRTGKYLTQSGQIKDSATKLEALAKLMGIPDGVTNEETVMISMHRREADIVEDYAKDIAAKQILALTLKDTEETARLTKEATALYESIDDDELRSKVVKTVVKKIDEEFRHYARPGDDFVNRRAKREIEHAREEQKEK